MSLPSSWGLLKWIWAEVLQSGALPHQQWYLWPAEQVAFPRELDVLLLPIQLPVSPVPDETLFPPNFLGLPSSTPSPLSFCHALALTHSSLRPTASALSPLSAEYPRRCSLAEMHWGAPKVDPQKRCSPQRFRTRLSEVNHCRE